MPFLDTKHQRAAVLIAVLGLGILIALAPYASGLIGIPVFYVVFSPVYTWLTRRMKPGFAAAAVVVLGILLILIPAISVVGLVVAEAQSMAAGVIRSPAIDRLSELRVAGFDVGAQVASLGQRAVTWIGASAFALLGTAGRALLHIAIAFFGLYFLLIAGGGAAWGRLRPYIPFSAKNADRLAKRFHDVTMATLIGTGVTAILQGVLVGLAFWAVGLPSALFWGVVTAVTSIFPVLGSGLIWLPGAVVLAVQRDFPRAIALLLFGLIVIGNIDNVIRPIVFRRWAQIHPLITLIGAFAGVRFFGILGLIIGPLALSYFVELLQMYSDEYLPGDNLDGQGHREVPSG